MLTVWRIVKARYARSAFDGEGARLHGGRWNSVGNPVVYTSDSPALAALETLAGLNNSALLSAFVLIPVSLPEVAVQALDAAALPPSWRSFPPPAELAALGDAWLSAAKSLALRVPSAVIEQQFNYLLNPRHPRFTKLAIGPTRIFAFDERLFKDR